MPQKLYDDTQGKLENQNYLVFIREVLMIKQELLKKVTSEKVPLSLLRHLMTKASHLGFKLRLPKVYGHSVERL